MALIVSPDFPWGSGPWCLPCSSCEQLGVACSVCYWISPLVSGLKVTKDLLRTEAGVELNSQMCQVGMATWYLVSCAQMLIDCTCVCVKSSFVIVCQRKQEPHQWEGHFEVTCQAQWSCLLTCLLPCCPESVEGCGWGVWLQLPQDYLISFIRYCKISKWKRFIHPPPPFGIV